LEILKIHAAGITKRGDIDFESVVTLADGLNGADMRNVCTEAGLFAIRADRDYDVEEDSMHKGGTQDLGQQEIGIQAGLQ
jgi:26S proteasome regulatory subunit T4